MNLQNTVLTLIGIATIAVQSFSLAAADIDAEAYRQAKVEATKTFFDPSAPNEDRIKAAENLGYPDDETMARLLGLGMDSDVDDDIRWEALRRHSFDLEWIEAVLTILEDPRNGRESLNANLVEILSQRTVVTLPVEVRQSMQRTYRTLLNDPRDSVRHHAYFASVSSEDPVALAKLVDGLKGGGAESPVPIADAIELLDLAGANRHFSTIRPYLNHDDPEIQAQAARVLALDNDSRPTIVRLVMEKRTPELVRIQALRGLSRADETLPGYAIPLVEDTEESIAVREAAMGAIVSQINYMQLAENYQIQFLKAVEAFASEPGVRTLLDDPNGSPQSRAQDLLIYLRNSTPELREYSLDQGQ